MVDLLAALNTGHEGGCGTIHANHPFDVPARVEALTSTAGIGRAAAHSQLVAAIDAVVHLARRPDGCRFVELIAVLERDEDGFVRAVPCFVVDAVGGVHTQQGVARWNQLLQRRR
ncbi:MAG: ATPase, T2SS/T4P/T4SS family, partial [Candidatus Nanopelagicales bacterium]